MGESYLYRAGIPSDAGDWRVVYNGALQRLRFHSREIAAAHLFKLVAGTAQPEGE